MEYERTGYDVQFLGKFYHSFDTDDELTAYDKYTVIRYYYETEEYDRLLCGSDGIPKNSVQYRAVNVFAKEARKRVQNWEHKKEFCYMKHEEIKAWMGRYQEKYPTFI